MKIGFVTGEYPPMQGGVGDFSRELAHALAALGHDVHVITHTSIGSGDFSRPLPTTKVVTTNVNVHPITRSWNLQSLLFVRRLVRALSLDLINIQYQAAAYGMTAPIHALPKVAGLPSVVTFHDLRVPYLFPKAGRLRRDAVNTLAHSASGVIVTNPEDRLALERDSRIKHLAEIPIGSNIKPFATHNGIRNTQYGPRWGFTDSDVVVGYFGFLNTSKGGETLFRALAQLPNYKLLLIGGRAGTSDPTNAAYAAQLDSLAIQLGVASRIIRTGFLPPAETTQALLACDLMAMPYVDGASFRRGTFMACLAHGLPTITTQPATPLPQLRDGDNIRLLPPEDPAALAAAIRELAADSALRLKLSIGALELAEEFTWDKIAMQTATFFEKILDRQE
ncbi:MAG: glycosyltransferase family 4 protein [Chloroflexi bacterium]|nr:glycosyltransferase family 4 protein [Chloroflexota bacterium]